MTTTKLKFDDVYAEIMREPNHESRLALGRKHFGDTFSLTNIVAVKREFIQALRNRSNKPARV